MTYIEDTMNAISFDTHKAVKTLKAAGVEEAQAEAFVETFGGALNDNVATKGDLQALGKDMQGEIAKVRAEIRDLEHRMTIRLGSIVIAGVGFLALIDRLFPVSGP